MVFQQLRGALQDKGIYFSHYLVGYRPADNILFIFYQPIISGEEVSLSVVIPVHNETGCIERVVQHLAAELASNKIEYEIILVNDNSTDETPQVLAGLAANLNGVKMVDSPAPKGFGKAIRRGLDENSKDIVVVFMGDGSDDVGDVTKYYNKILEGYDCVFGSRFIKGSRVVGYPKAKLVLNRLGNALIQVLFLLQYI